MTTSSHSAARVAAAQEPTRTATRPPSGGRASFAARQRYQHILGAVAVALLPACGQGSEGRSSAAGAGGGIVGVGGTHAGNGAVNGGSGGASLAVGGASASGGGSAVGGSPLVGSGGAMTSSGGSPSGGTGGVMASGGTSGGVGVGGAGSQASGGRPGGGSGGWLPIAGGGGLAYGGSPSFGGDGGTAGGGASVLGGAGGIVQGGGGGTASGGTGAGGAPPTCPATYANPIIWEDLPDVEVIRVEDTYYYTASTFHHSPGAPVLRSSDLVHWEYIGHSVPLLDFHPRYDLSGGQSYRNGIWASSLRYRESNETFYWIGCMHNIGGAYVFTATSPEGPWTKHASEQCYYDVGLLIDDDDTMYVAYGNGTISVAQLTPDGLGQVRAQPVFETPGDLSGPLEGSRFYKIDGDYYILVTQYANGEYVLRSTNGPFGPYELRPFAVRLPFAGAGAGASPHQGGIVETQHGDWYYIGFNDSYPAGRLPVMAPVTWSDGWPSVTLVNGAFGAEYPFPNLPCGAGAVEDFPRSDTFSEAALGHEWEWNHNPDDTKWSAGEGLTLQTATVTSDLYAARNTLTRRIVGPVTIATIELDYGDMQVGDVAGLAAFRDSSAWIGIEREAGADRVVMVSGLELDDSTWDTISTGTERASGSVSGGKIWLRVEANVRTDAGGGQARFYYSTDGSQFTELGTPFTMKRDWPYFLGYRFGIFNYATQALGGSVTVERFELSVP